MNSKPSSPASKTAAEAVVPGARRRAAGFTLLEALVALAVTAILIAFGVAVTMLTQRVSTSEQVRTELNQNLRTALDLIGADVRVAGERLAGTDNRALRAIEIRPDELILRRSLLGETLTACNEPFGASAGDTRIQVAAVGSSRSECDPIDDDGDGVPDKIAAWRDLRLEHGGTLNAFITTASGARSEFFVYDGENPGTFEIASAAALGNGYPFGDVPVIVAMTENRYFVQDGTLFMERDRDPATRIRLVPNVEELEVQLTFRDGGTESEYDITDSEAWSDIRSVDLVLRGRIDVNGDPYERSLSASYFPRNALSN